MDEAAAVVFFLTCVMAVGILPCRVLDVARVFLENSTSNFLTRAPGHFAAEGDGNGERSPAWFSPWLVTRHLWYWCSAASVSIALE